ncbi:hypothetical protein [Agilicoccus flavus]|uniref:hypothetical protein n=1 Tax=Agilicoccus flavus TaxID=2775968 RepID=UPI001CF68D41|nr:hypothetical protein [Agilicoccus flavus]
MNQSVSREKEPSPFAWIFSGALGVVLGGAAWAAARAALRRKDGGPDVVAEKRPDRRP